MNIPSIIFILLLGYSFSLSKYKLSNVSYLNPSLKTKINGTLLYESPNTFNPSEFSCSQLRNPNNIKLITNLSLSLSLEYDDIIHVRITDRNTAGIFHIRVGIDDTTLHSRDSIPRSL